MTEQSDDNARWCAAFAAMLVDETRVSPCDAAFLAEQARVLSHGLPPSYAVRRALSDAHLRTERGVAGRLWSPSNRSRPLVTDDIGAVGW
jgi:hypothetical protein